MATTQRSSNGSSDDDEPSRNKPDATWNLLCSDRKASNEKIDNGEGFSEATGSKAKVDLKQDKSQKVAIVDLEQDKLQKIENVEGFSEDTGCLSKGKEIVDLEQDKSQKPSSSLGNSSCWIPHLEDTSDEIENVEGFSEDTGCLSKGKEIVDLEQDKSQKPSSSLGNSSRWIPHLEDTSDEGSPFHNWAEIFRAERGRDCEMSTKLSTLQNNVEELRSATNRISARLAVLESQMASVAVQGKEVLCHDFPYGRCKNGVHCKFAYSYGELNHNSRSTFRSEPCLLVPYCPHPLSCMYRH